MKGISCIRKAFQGFHKLALQKELWENIEWNATAAKDIWKHAKIDTFIHRDLRVCQRNL
jgi:hypothetical protein